MTLDMIILFFALVILMLCIAEWIRVKAEKHHDRAIRKYFYHKKSQRYRAEVLRSEHTH